MALYKFRKNPITGQVESVIKNLGDNKYLGILLNNTENADTQEYLEWAKIGRAHV